MFPFLRGKDVLEGVERYGSDGTKKIVYQKVRKTKYHQPSSALVLQSSPVYRPTPQYNSFAPSRPVRDNYEPPEGEDSSPVRIVERRPAVPLPPPIIHQNFQPNPNQLDFNHGPMQGDFAAIEEGPHEVRWPSQSNQLVHTPDNGGQVRVLRPHRPRRRNSSRHRRHRHEPEYYHSGESRSSGSPVMRYLEPADEWEAAPRYLRQHKRPPSEVDSWDGGFARVKTGAPKHHGGGWGRTGPSYW